ncbi:MAG TPA: hypothetical protein VMC09_17475 [Anaerolineales bacterium]|nr:hypothetical protein [Anaerolineales bacterium]
MAYFTLCIFLSAFLVFQVEPMIAKYILPWFGGTPAVWSTVMLFFQILLTGGYAYAAWLTGKARRRETVHLVLLGISALLVVGLGLAWKSPITPSAAWKPQGNAFPVGQIFKLLLVSVGLPYFLLASNSPLIQTWYHRALPEKTAYRLYALSNIGSLLALVSYPILIEPNLSLPWQGWIWSIAYLVYAGLSAYGTVQSLRTGRFQADRKTDPNTGTTTARLSVADALLWIGLAAAASILFMAVTSQITQEVAVIPFLWVLPLTIYLLTFILAFADERWYSRQAYLVVFFAATALAGWALGRSAALGIWPQIGIYSVALFAACMVCHGELYRLRPDASRLTTFYLMVSIGGAVGGLAINFIAPYLFKGYWELPLGLAFAWILFLLAVIRRRQDSRRWLFVTNAVILLSAIAITILRSYEQIHADLTNEIYLQRNFFGVVRVRETDFYAVIPIHVGSIDQNITAYHRFALVHGVTIHGFQFHDPGLKSIPTSYYGASSGIGLAILNHPNRGSGMRVGVLGLGIGSLAVYGQPGDVYRFYEINPQVIDLARGEGGYFSYLSDSPAKIDIVQGDARLSLEAELAAGQPQNYDVLALDVFSSDAIPVHLLDSEAFALYLKHLNPGGILAVHITNSHLNLAPVVLALAEHYDLSNIMITNPGDGVSTYPSVWVLLSRDPALLANPAIAGHGKPIDVNSPRLRLWTDDYNDLFQILH